MDTVNITIQYVNMLIMKSLNSDTFNEAIHIKMLLISNYCSLYMLHVYSKICLSVMTSLKLFLSAKIELDF